MTNRSRFFVLAIVAVLGGTAVDVCVSGGDGPAPAPPEKSAPRTPVNDSVAVLQIAGNVACGGKCHGRLEANTDRARLGQNEFAAWVAHDKHAQAYALLFDERAKHMADNLAATNKDGKKIPAHEDARCLACHATPQLAEAAPSPTRDVMLFDGVGCEACHGAARGPKPWLQEHLHFKDVRHDPAAQVAKYREYGMTHLQDPLVQAKVCVGCHVGAPADAEAHTPLRDANHDIMGAGHPRLTFEFTAYHDNMPPHWRADTPRRGTDAQSWALGQLATARASVQLLEDRARRPDAPWPEFAEYDCFACHTGLQEPSWRRANLFGDRKKKGYRPGAPPYSVWSSTMLPHLTPTPDKAVASAIERLSEAMSQRLPERKTAGNKTTTVLAALKALEKQVLATQYTEGIAAAIVKNLAAVDDDASPLTWEEVQQFTLAVAALRPNLPAAAKKHLDDVNTLLAYPPGSESPSHFRRGKQLDNALLDLRKALR
jgi:hypothetical protein